MLYARAMRFFFLISPLRMLAVLRRRRCTCVRAQRKESKIFRRRRRRRFLYMRGKSVYKKNKGACVCVCVLSAIHHPPYIGLSTKRARRHPS